MKSNAGEAMKDVDDDTYVRADGTFVDSIWIQRICTII